MIHAVNGIIHAKKKQAIALAVGPMTLDIAVPDESFFTIDTPYNVLTYLHWTQDNGPLLYGFKEEIDRAVFLLVISCSGVGPRLGLAVLADLGASQCIQAIHKGDDRILSKVSGIGTKKAEQIIVQLKHKIHDFLAAGIDVSSDASHIDWHTISDALRALNYSRGEVAAAIAFIRDKDQNKSASFDQLLRQALSFLSKQQ
jgi:Holliday junction DNA helicase RuvA